MDRPNLDEYCRDYYKPHVVVSKYIEDLGEYCDYMERENNVTLVAFLMYCSEITGGPVADIIEEYLKKARKRLKEMGNSRIEEIDLEEKTKKYKNKD